MEHSLIELGLNPKLHGHLIRYRIKTIEDLCKLDRYELISIRGLGDIYIDEIVRKLHAKGYYLKDEEVKEGKITESLINDNSSLDRLNLTSRLAGVLRILNCKSIKDIILLKTSDILTLNNVTTETKNLLIDTIHDNGLCFSDEEIINDEIVKKPLTEKSSFINLEFSNGTINALLKHNPNLTIGELRNINPLYIRGLGEGKVVEIKNKLEEFDSKNKSM